jgi:Zn-finger nucleic acid-binding protein
MEQRPKPPKVCPVCFVAMQATKTEEKIVHLCQRCGLTITVGSLPKKDQ